MKDTLKTLIETAKTTGALFQDKISEAGQAAIDGTIQAIEKWLEEFPKLESYGLKVANFSFVMRLSPSLEVEMRGVNADFPPQRIAEILAENKSTSLTGMIFSAIRTTYRLHAKISPAPVDPLIVKIKLSLSPEISVFIGTPRVN